MKIEEFFQDADIANLDNIVRWDLNQMIKEETVSQHSYWVGVFSTVLAEELFPNPKVEGVPEIKLAVTRMALFHDSDEGFTGDIPHLVKNNPKYGKAIKESLEGIIKDSVESKFNGENPLDRMMRTYLLPEGEFMKMIKHIVKIADWLSFLKYLKNERTLGNANVIDTIDYCQLGLQKQIVKTKEILIPMKEKYDVNLEPLENLLYV